MLRLQFLDKGVFVDTYRIRVLTDRLIVLTFVLLAALVASLVWEVYRDYQTAPAQPTLTQTGGSVEVDSTLSEEDPQLLKPEDERVIYQTSGAQEHMWIARLLLFLGVVLGVFRLRRIKREHLDDL